MENSGVFITRPLKGRGLIAFFVIVYLLTAAAIPLVSGVPGVLPFVLVIIPAITAIALTAILEGPSGVRQLLRMAAIWRVGWRWYLAALGLPVLGALIMVGLAVALGAPSEGLFDRLSPAALLVPAVVFIPALLEEIGFRGFALPRLLEGRSALAAGLILGVLWAVVHLPLYLPGQDYASLPFWPEPLILISYSVLLAWVFINTGGSVWMAALFHAALNGTVPLTWGIDPVLAWELRGIVFTAMAVMVIALTGKDLVRKVRAGGM